MKRELVAKYPEVGTDADQIARYQVQLIGNQSNATFRLMDNKLDQLNHHSAALNATMSTFVNVMLQGRKKSVAKAIKKLNESKEPAINAMRGTAMVIEEVLDDDDEPDMMDTETAPVTEGDGDDGGDDGGGNELNANGAGAGNADADADADAVDDAYAEYDDRSYDGASDGTDMADDDDETRFKHNYDNDEEGIPVIMHPLSNGKRRFSDSTDDDENTNPNTPRSANVNALLADVSVHKKRRADLKQAAKEKAELVAKEKAEAAKLEKAEAAKLAKQKSATTSTATKKKTASTDKPVSTTPKRTPKSTANKETATPASTPAKKSASVKTPVKHAAVASNKNTRSKR